MHFTGVSITENYVHWQLDVYIWARDHKAAPVCFVPCDLKLSLINQPSIAEGDKLWRQYKVIRCESLTAASLSIPLQQLRPGFKLPSFFIQFNSYFLYHKQRQYTQHSIINLDSLNYYLKIALQNMSTWPQCFLKWRYCHCNLHSSQAIYSIWQYNKGFKAFFYLWLARFN